MEKKTLGSFIALLRKSRGMTQRELAEKLGVSDKTISHWERDESAPDISMIPVIAEIFDVTCDELLKGEKARLASIAEQYTVNGLLYAQTAIIEAEKQVRFNAVFPQCIELCMIKIRENNK